MTAIIFKMINVLTPFNENINVVQYFSEKCSFQFIVTFVIYISNKCNIEVSL